MKKTEEFIIKRIKLFTPVKESGHKLEEHHVLDLQEELKLLELELIPLKTGNGGSPTVQEVLIH